MVAMRWLQNISFASSPPPSSSPSSSSEGDDDDHADQQCLHGVSSRRFRLAAAKLWSRRKLRHITDREVSKATGSHATLTVPPSRTTSSASTSAVPMPLPLPVPDGEGETRLQSGKEVGYGYGKVVEDRVRGDGPGDGVSAGSPALSSMGCTHDRKATNRLGSRSSSSSSQALHQNLNAMHSFHEALMIDVPTRSAVTSPSCSPAPSPQRIQHHDKNPYFYMGHRGNQGWSAPEMPTFDHPGGFLPPSFLDCSTFSTESSPHHSPHRSIKSASGPASPLHPKLSLETSALRHEGFTSVHRLPLPPVTAVSSPSTPAPQVTTKSEPIPMPMNCQWQKGKLIGRGTFGSVYVASNRETGALCAMKEVDIFPDDPKSAECIKQLDQEISVLSHLKHPNIVQYYGSETKEDTFNIYLEYVHPGSINKYVREHFGAITESVVRNFTRHILSGLAYLHNKKTIHRDIKGANLLVDASGVVKLADFGMAKHLTGQRLDLSLKGSPYWMAPELMQAVMQKDNSSDHAFAIDIWSLGCTIIEMLTGKPPWSEYEGAAAMFKVMRDTPAIPENLSPEGKDFLQCCFRRNPADRPSALMLLEHRFAKNSLQPTVPSGVTSINGRKSVDLPIGPREHLYEVKVDELPGVIGPSSSSSKSRTSDSFMHYSFSPVR